MEERFANGFRLQLEHVFVGFEIGAGGVLNAGDGAHFDVAAEEPAGGMGGGEGFEAGEGGEVVGFVGDENAPGEEEVSGEEVAGVAVVEGDAVFVGAGGGDDGDEAAAEVDGALGGGEDGGFGAVFELGDALVLGDVLGGGMDDRQGKGRLAAKGAEAAEETIDNRAEGIVFFFGGGAGIDEQGAVGSGEEVGEGGFPVDGDVFAEDDRVFVIGDDLDAGIAIGGGADGAVIPLLADGARGGGGGGVVFRSGGGVGEGGGGDKTEQGGGEV